MPLNLLIVENEADQRKILIDSIDLFNKGIGNEIVYDEAENLQVGLDKLRKNQYDAAIVDLRLEQNDTIGQGNEILKEIKSKLRFPVRVVSGHLGDLDQGLMEKTFFFNRINRGEEDYEIILAELWGIYTTGITRILNNRGLIESNINDVFWKHISTVLHEFIDYKKANPTWNIEKVLLRYISTHIQEYLELTIDNNFEAFHPIEYYIKPPVKEKIFTGDILKHKELDNYYMVVTPACDLATDGFRPVPKAEYVTVIALDEAQSVLAGKNTGDIKKLKANNFEFKYHYLPNTPQFNGGFLNFQKVRSIRIAECNENYNVILSISGPFKKDIISRFSNYFSRQGQPAFN